MQKYITTNQIKPDNVKYISTKLNICHFSWNYIVSFLHKPEKETKIKILLCHLNTYNINHYAIIFTENVILTFRIPQCVLHI